MVSKYCDLFIYLFIYGFLMQTMVVCVTFTLRTRKCNAEDASSPDSKSLDKSTSLTVLIMDWSMTMTVFFKCKTMSWACHPMTERYHVTQDALPSCQSDHKPKFNQMDASTNHKINKAPFWHICMLLMINQCQDFEAVNINSHAFP